ncbi:MAG: STAS domain-containing protein [Rhodoplanes sp.]
MLMGVMTCENRGVMVVAVQGDLNATTGGDLSQSMDQLLKDGRRRFVLDLKDIKFVDSSGLSTLVRCLKRTRGEGGELHLAGLQSAVKRTFELTRLDRSFDIQPDVAKAVQALGKA